MCRRLSTHVKRDWCGGRISHNGSAPRWHRALSTISPKNTTTHLPRPTSFLKHNQQHTPLCIIEAIFHRWRRCVNVCSILEDVYGCLWYVYVVWYVKMYLTGRDSGYFGSSAEERNAKHMCGVLSMLQLWLQPHTHISRIVYMCVDVRAYRRTSVPKQRVRTFGRPKAVPPTAHAE